VLRGSVPRSLAALVVLPAALYVLSWAGWFVTDDGYDRTWAQDNPASGLAGLVPDPLRSWWAYHRAIFSFHDELRSSHPYQSHPAGWLLLARPVSFYYPQDIGPGEYGCTAASCSREVLAVGTPALWWGFVVVAALLLWLWLARRDWRPAAVLVMVATAIVPWVRDDLDGRTMFLFYALPAVPFMCLGLALVAGYAWGGPGTSPHRRRTAALATGGYLVVIVANFAWLYPLLAAQTIPYDDWRARILFTSWI
jgi:dolichyl-phosphate-mannose-protein mannosyltransferase